jgi:hypothetical protein
MFLNIIKDCLQDPVFLSLAMLFGLLLVVEFVRCAMYHIRDNFGLEDKREICKLVHKHKGPGYDDTAVYDWVHPEGLCLPQFLEFTFYVHGEKIVRDVPLLLEDVAEGQYLAVTYAITHLSKKIKIRRVETAKLPCPR